MARHLVLDTETTGLDPRTGHRLIEIACVEVIDFIPTARNFHRYVHPDREIDPDAERVHGISLAFLKDKPRFHEIVDDFLEFVGDDPIVAHNAPFDRGFVNAELARLGRGRITDVVARITDSLAMARELFPGKANSLDALCRRLEVDNSNRSLHGALLDAGLLAEVYIRMTRGQDSLVMDEQDGAERRIEVADIDLERFDLPVIVATASETAAHETVLEDLDKATGGKTLWRRLEVVAES